MALAKEIMGISLLEKSSFLNSSSMGVLNPNMYQKENQLWFNHQFQGRRSLRTRKAFRASPIAAISENLIKVVSEKAVKFKVRAVVTVRNKNKEDLKETIVKHLDAFTDKIGRNVALELISTDIDQSTKGPKKSNQAVLKDWSKKSNLKTERVNYTAEFVVDSNFGTPGAITVTNKHQQEFFLESITIEGFACGPVHFPCNSWVQPKKDHPGKRVFFSNKPYLPNETPAGLKSLRERELRALRGDGTGVRKLSDRIYDYDIYNDLGNKDKGTDFARPKLGGDGNVPYPRRCRTGRVSMDTDISAESRVEKPNPTYVPRDEQFEESKMNAFSTGRLKAVLHNLIPSLMASISSNNHDFKGFSDIDSLYSEGLLLKLGLQDEVLKKLPLPKVVSTIKEGALLKYDTPKIVSNFSVFPPVSKLEPEIYGPQESALKDEHILGHLNGMTVQEALDANKLFIVDYHDVYLPFLDRINALDGRKAYATRTIFFLSNLGTLKPIAIELSLPQNGPSSRSKRVVTPPLDATSNWIWQLAKAHVCSNDAGVHQLVNHWLRTHASLEPFIIAAHRQLSAIYTLEINGVARRNLINADGVIEACFTPGRYAMEIDLLAYKNWRFDLEGLPVTLSKGWQDPDSTRPRRSKLVIEDYPYGRARNYVNHYYQDSAQVCNDKELQAWYAESINVGHADLRNADWWPILATPEDLISILTTIIRLASRQHAAPNFGRIPWWLRPQPATAHAMLCIPSRSSKIFFSALPSLLQATKFMAVVDTLSTHSPDEEYLGERNQPSTWTGDAKEIDEKNTDTKLRNRCGAGVLPYELLAPSSCPGVTCRGVPNSVSI
ncbi:unnamed protein product [Withania somnifera]